MCARLCVQINCMRWTAAAYACLDLLRSPQALAAASARLAKFGSRATLMQGSYAQVQRLLRKASWPAQVHGILLDLGVSSWQLDAAHRGFSYAREGPLDMRFDQQASPSAQAPTAADLVNGLPEVELMRIFRDMGDEPHAALVARAVVATRAQWAAAARAAGDTARAEAPIQTTAQLTDIVERTVRNARSIRIDMHRAAKARSMSRQHPAARVFQALRIAVNAELAHFHQFMQHVPSVLAPGASLAVITFQPTETAMLRKHMKQHVRQQRMHTPTWLPAWMVPAADEVQANPRARTARLGVLTRAQEDS